jgi:lipoprotein-anchoring transpeptidase ErfK/SrfK
MGRRGAALSLAGVAIALGAGFGALRLEGGDDGPTRADPLPAVTQPSTASGRPGPPAPPEQVQERPGSLVATAEVPLVSVFDAPGAPKPSLTLTHPNEENAPRVFLVKETQDDWLRVLLPVRPNGRTGWIRASEVSLASNPFRIRIELGAHQLIVWRGDELIAREPVGVGRADTPTPGGEYYLTELLQPPTPNGPYGPFAFGLSGFSDVYKNYAGGNGVIGLHGTNDPGGLGKDVSAGCIRMRNESIVRLAQLLPLGTPVEILA